MAFPAWHGMHAQRNLPDHEEIEAFVLILRMFLQDGVGSQCGRSWRSMSGCPCHKSLSRK